MSLGKGVFGEVLKMRNILDIREYARGRQLYKKMIREVELLSRLNHENVVRYCNSWIESVNEEDMKCPSIKQNIETVRGGYTDGIGPRIGDFETLFTSSIQNALITRSQTLMLAHCKQVSDDNINFQKTASVNTFPSNCLHIILKALTRSLGGDVCWIGAGENMKRYQNLISRIEPSSYVTILPLK
uniref:Protein kinase domain-containing protein n=1 Tax=Glossina brevipalpis TaxID=37001 RepID=A0A1A9WA51_9MUSC